MMNTSVVSARIDAGLKESAEEILSEIGVTPSGAIEMLYSQIILFHGLPFPARKPTAIGGMTQEEINREIQKGWDSMEAGNVISAKEENERLRRKYGI